MKKVTSEEAYMKCIEGFDNKEIRNMIVDSEWVYAYCIQFRRNLEEMRTKITKSEDAYRYCEYIDNIEEMRNKIVDQILLYNFCFHIQDVEDVWKRITDSKVAYWYCSSVKDRSEVACKITSEPWKSKYNEFITNKNLKSVEVKEETEYKMGQLIEFGESNWEDWGYITYPFGGDGKELVDVVGLGKSGSFPVVSSRIRKVLEVDSYLSRWHKKDHILWCNRDASKFYYSCSAEYKCDGSIIAEGPNVYFKFRIITETGKIEYLDRIEASFFYQFDKLVLLLRSKKEFTNNMIIETVRNYMNTNLGVLEKVKFPILGEKIEHESYFDEEMYYELT